MYNSIAMDGLNFFSIWLHIKVSLQKICQNTVFLSPVFSRNKIESICPYTAKYSSEKASVLAYFTLLLFGRFCLSKKPILAINIQG